MDVKEGLLPGVGLRYEFTSHKGDRIGGQLRAGTALIARGEFSLIIIGLIGMSIPAVAALATSSVFVMAIVGPVLARYIGGTSPARHRTYKLTGH